MFSVVYVTRGCNVVPALLHVMSFMLLYIYTGRPILLLGTYMYLLAPKLRGSYVVNF